MTIQGALNDLSNLLTSSDIPMYYKPSLKKIKETIELEMQPKMGEWIIIDDCEQFIAKCSECGRIEDSRMISKYPYCHCGAKMGGGEE